MHGYRIEQFGIDHLRWQPLPARQPGPGEVALSVRAWSLNFRDLLMVRGLYNPRLKLPRIPLSDGVGIVSEIGPGVTRVKVGDRVAGAFMPDWLAGGMTEATSKRALGGNMDGMAAEQVVLPAEALVLVPEHLTDAEAATLPCAAVTAWNALVVQGQLRAGESVLIEGTGGVALFALQIALACGARVIATTGSEAKAERLRALGASAVVNYKTEKNWGDKVRELSGNAGVDLVVEVAGGANVTQAVRAVRSGGQIALIGVLAEGAVDPLPILMRHIRLQGILVGSRAMFEDLNRAIGVHKLRPVVDRVCPFTEIVAAMRYQESGAHFGKVVLAAT